MTARVRSPTVASVAKKIISRERPTEIFLPRNCRRFFEKIDDLAPFGRQIVNFFKQSSAISSVERALVHAVEDSV